MMMATLTERFNLPSGVPSPPHAPGTLFRTHCHLHRHFPLVVFIRSFMSLWPLYFYPVVSIYLSSSFSSSNLSGRTLDDYHTSTHGVALVRIQNAGLKCAARGSLKIVTEAVPRCKTRWKLQGCLKLPDRSQPLVGRSSPYCGDMSRTYCCLTNFFPIVDTCLSCKDIARQSCAMVPRWRFLATFLRPVFPASRAQHVSDLHLKFALRPHHVRKYGRHPISDCWD